MIILVGILTITIFDFSKEKDYEGINSVNIPIIDQGDFSKEIYIKFLKNYLKVTPAIDDIVDQKNIKKNPRVLKQVKHLINENYIFSNGVIGDNVNFPHKVSEFAVYTNDQISYFYDRVLTNKLSDEDIVNLNLLNKQIKKFTKDLNYSNIEEFNNLSLSSIKDNLLKRVNPIAKKGYQGFYGKSAFE